jgi:hypothetical protein
MSLLKVVLKGRELKIFPLLSDSTAYATVKLCIKTNLLLVFIRYYYTIANSIGRAAKGQPPGLWWMYLCCGEW